MRERFVVLTLFLSALPAHAEPQEMLRTVSEDQARRLEEYNRVFLQQELYSAARHRIVSVDTALLLRDEAITITPFSDVKPLVVTLERAQRTDTYVNWFGRIHFDDARYAPLGAKFYTPITMVWWDLNDSGDAELSGSSKLHRRAFGSLSARMELPTGQTYIVTPLAYTPRYSVVYELDKDKIVPIPFEAGDATTPEQLEKVARYEAFRDSLPIEKKAVRGDLE